MLNEVEGYTVVAGVNGDHFSYTTGVAMGFSMDDGEILESPTTDKKCRRDICSIPSVLPGRRCGDGYNPTLIATYQKGSPIEDRGPIDLDQPYPGELVGVQFVYRSVWRFHQDHGNKRNKGLGACHRCEEWRKRVGQGEDRWWAGCGD